MVIASKPIYHRILLKLSGEILQGNENLGIDINVLVRVAKEIAELAKLGIQIGIVIGGGNLFRGTSLVKAGINRVIGDQMGMLATVINGLAVCDMLHNFCVKTYLMSSIPILGIGNNYDCFKAIELLHNNYVVIFVAGTGNPLFTSDSAACLRGIEVSADVVFKATKVDGVFSNDPNQYPDVVFYDHLSYKDALKKELKIMDLAAFMLARDYNLPIRIFNINKSRVLWKIVMGYKEGTLITN